MKTIPEPQSLNYSDTLKPKIKKSALDKRITGLQLKYELLKDVEIKELTKRIEELEKIVETLHTVKVDPNYKEPKTIDIDINQDKPEPVQHPNYGGVMPYGNQPEQKIAFEKFIATKNNKSEFIPASRNANNYGNVEEIIRLDSNTYIFKAWDIDGDIPAIYIGHYE